LALFSILQRHAPDHPALLGPWRDLLSLAGISQSTSSLENSEVSEPGPLEREIIALDADHFNLLAFLICAHHGKIGLAWHACPADQDATQHTIDGAPRLRGLRDGDELPGLPLVGSDGNFHGLPGTRLDLAPAAAGLNPSTGPGWTERVLGLLARHGPFALAWLESLLRAADQRTSRDTLPPDPLLEKDNGNLGLERSDSRLAETAGGGETRHPLATDPAECLPEHGLRAGTSGPVAAGSSTCLPADATRHLETRLGILTYAQLAPYLAGNVQSLEEWIEAGEFDAAALDDSLIETLHTLICGDLTPQLVGWRRYDVCVGQHTPPQFYLVPVLMREYGRDLEARLQASGQAVGDRLLETLAFAEGRLLSIHPFADFNGRVTRVFLRLLLRRLDLPFVDLLPPPEEWQDYLTALRAADHLHWQPLMTIWQQRFVKGVAQ
jgi:CRISPR-associated endonuclease/helicase Cas3